MISPSHLHHPPRVCVIAGDDAAPEVVHPTLTLLRRLAPEITFHEAPCGRVAQELFGTPFPESTKREIDETDCTLFGASGGPSRAILWYLRWTKDTCVNLRPIRWQPGYQSPMRHPERIDYLIVRDNLEGMYPPREGRVQELSSLASSDKWWLPPPVEQQGSYALKVCTDAQARRVATVACEIALTRKAQGYPGRITLGAKYSILPQTDGRFREIMRAEVEQHPELGYQEFLIDDLARRMIAEPESLDVVVLGNEHGDILADAAAGTIGGLGLAPSACYGPDYAYFEPVHGSAPDLAGKGVINPTATLLTGALLLRYLNHSDKADHLEAAITQTYQAEKNLTVDQGGQASTESFIQQIADLL